MLTLDNAKAKLHRHLECDGRIVTFVYWVKEFSNKFIYIWLVDFLASLLLYVSKCFHSFPVTYVYSLVRPAAADRGVETEEYDFQPVNGQLCVSAAA